MFRQSLHLHETMEQKSVMACAFLDNGLGIALLTDHIHKPCYPHNFFSESGKAWIDFNHHDQQVLILRSCGPLPRIRILFNIKGFE